MKNDKKFLRHLVDTVWSDAKESGEVPSTIHADKLIEKARETFKIDTTKLNISNKPANVLCEGCSHNEPMEDSVYCINCRNEPI